MSNAAQVEQGVAAAVAIIRRQLQAGLVRGHYGRFTVSLAFHIQDGSLNHIREGFTGTIDGTAIDGEQVHQVPRLDTIRR